MYKLLHFTYFCFVFYHIVLVNKDYHYYSDTQKQRNLARVGP